MASGVEHGAARTALVHASEYGSARRQTDRPVRCTCTQALGRRYSGLSGGPRPHEAAGLGFAVMALGFVQPRMDFGDPPGSTGGTSPSHS